MKILVSWTVIWAFVLTSGMPGYTFTYHNADHLRSNAAKENLADLGGIMDMLASGRRMNRPNFDGGITENQALNRAMTDAVKYRTMQYLNALNAQDTADLWETGGIVYGKEQLAKLDELGKALPAFNLVSPQYAEGMILAAMEMNAALILEVALSQDGYAMTFQQATDEVNAAFDRLEKRLGYKPKVPVIMHGDHIQYKDAAFDTEAILKGLYLEYTEDTDIESIPESVLDQLQEKLAENAAAQRKKITDAVKRLRAAGFTSVAIDASTIYDKFAVKLVKGYYAVLGTKEEQIVIDLVNSAQLPTEWDTNFLKLDPTSAAGRTMIKVKKAEVKEDMEQLAWPQEEIDAKMAEMDLYAGALYKAAEAADADYGKMVSAYEQVMKDISQAKNGVTKFRPEIETKLTSNQKKLLLTTSNDAETIFQNQVMTEVWGADADDLIREVEVGHVDAKVLNPITGKEEPQLSHPYDVTVMLEDLAAEGIYVQFVATNNGSGHGTVFNEVTLVPESQVLKIKPMLTNELADHAAEYGAFIAQHGTSGSRMVELSKLADWVRKFNIATNYQQLELNVYYLAQTLEGRDLIDAVHADMDALVEGLHVDVRERMKEVAQAIVDGDMDLSVREDDSIFTQFLKLTYAWGIENKKIKKGTKKEIGKIFAKENKRVFGKMYTQLKDVADTGARVEKDIPDVLIMAEGVTVGAQNQVARPITVSRLTQLGLDGSILTHSDNRKKSAANLIGGETRLNKMANDRFKALRAADKFICLCVGSSADNAADQIDAILVQLEERLAGVSETDLLSGKQVWIAQEPEALIGAIQKAGGADVAAETDMIREVHQAILDWFIENYSLEAALSAVRILYGASVSGDNVDRLMDVKSESPRTYGLPLVHGALFASSGKTGAGFVAVAEGIERAAIRDGQQYVCCVNLKAMDDKDSHSEYLSAIYTALLKDTINQGNTILAIADTDVDLMKWQSSLAEMEDTLKFKAGAEAVLALCEDLMGDSEELANGFVKTALNTADDIIVPALEERFMEETKDDDQYYLLSEGSEYFAIAKENQADQTLMTAPLEKMISYEAGKRDAYYSSLLGFVSAQVTATGKAVELIEAEGDMLLRYLARPSAVKLTREVAEIGDLNVVKHWLGSERFFQMEYSSGTEETPMLMTFKPSPKLVADGYSAIVQPRVNVLVNGYGTIGQKAALAARKAGFWVSVTARSVKKESRDAADKGYPIYLTDLKSAGAFAAAGMEVAGSLEDALPNTDIVIDGTPGKVGAENLKNIYSKYDGLKVIFEGGEKAGEGVASFSSGSNYETVTTGNKVVRVVSCNTTGMDRLINPIAEEHEIIVDNTANRRLADPGTSGKGNPDAVTYQANYHHGPDLMTVLSEKAKANIAGINTDAAMIPTTHFHFHVLTVRGVNGQLNAEKVKQILKVQSRVALVEFPGNLFDTAQILDIDQSMLSGAAHPFVIIAQVQDSGIKGDVKILYAVPQESDVVPENANALQAMTGLFAKDPAIRVVNEAMGIDNIKAGLEKRLPATFAEAAKDGGKLDLTRRWGNELSFFAQAFAPSVKNSVSTRVKDFNDVKKQEGALFPVLVNEEVLKSPDGIMALQNIIEELGGNAAIRFVLHIDRDSVNGNEVAEILDRINNKINQGGTRITADMFARVVVGTNAAAVQAQVERALRTDIFEVIGSADYVGRFRDVIKVILDVDAIDSTTLMSKALTLGVELVASEGKMTEEQLQELDALFTMDAQGNYHVQPLRVAPAVASRVEQHKLEVELSIGI